jgi:mono/diheme cytochrome c family protein
MAGPATYEIDGEQYVAVTVGYGGALAMMGGEFPRRPGRLYVYKLGGTVKAPDFPPFVPSPPLDLSTVTASTGNVAHGRALIAQWCVFCHVGGIYTPELTRSPRITSPALFREVVLEGTLRSRGMANFSQWLGAQDAEDIRAALIHDAREARRKP